MAYRKENNYRRLAREMKCRRCEGIYGRDNDNDDDDAFLFLIFHICTLRLYIPRRRETCSTTVDLLASDDNDNTTTKSTARPVEQSRESFTRIG